MFDKLKRDAWIEILKTDPSFYFTVPNETRSDKAFVELFTPKKVKADLVEK